MAVLSLFVMPVFVLAYTCTTAFSRRTHLLFKREICCSFSLNFIQNQQNFEQKRVQAPKMASDFVLLNRRRVVWFGIFWRSVVFVASSSFFLWLIACGFDIYKHYKFDLVWRYKKKCRFSSNVEKSLQEIRAKQ